MYQKLKTFKVLKNHFISNQILTQFIKVTFFRFIITIITNIQFPSDFVRSCDMFVQNFLVRTSDMEYTVKLKAYILVIV